MPARLASARRLLLTTDAVGGVWTYAVDLAAGLAARGWHVTLAVLGPSPEADRRAEVEALAGVDLIDTGLPLDWLANGAADLAAAAVALAELARRVRASLVHLHSAALAVGAAYPVPVVVTHHSCVATWWAAVRGGTLPDDFAWRTALTREGLQAAARVLAPTKGFAGAIAAAYRIEPPHVVSNGRAAVALGDAPMLDAAVSAGRLWDEGKNAATLDRAAALTRLPVRLAGPLAGPNGASLSLHHAEALGSLDAGAVRALLARRPVYVSTALYEPFGLAVLEAAQAGCALVLSDIPTFRELWDGAAVLVPARDEAAVAGALDALAADAARRAALGAAARERSHRYSADAFVAGTEAAYLPMLATTARSVA